MRLRVATFNMENLDDGAGGPPIAARIPTLQAQLRRLDADILCLQEINGQKAAGSKARDLAALDAVLRGTGYQEFHRAHTVSDRTGGAFDVHNLVILSRWRIGGSRQVLHDFVAPLPYRYVAAAPGAGEVRWDRPILRAVIDLGGERRLHVLNLHLRAPIAAAVPGGKSSATAWRHTSAWAEGYFLAELKRSGQALEARLLVDSIFDSEPQAALLVCGDFNAETQDTATRILMAPPEDTGNRDLAPRALVPLESGEADPSQFTVLHGGRRVSLDHILASASLATACRRVTIDNSALLDETEPPALSRLRPGSYHAPVVAEFIFDPAISTQTRAS